jgi:hypothetical protein
MNACSNKSITSSWRVKHTMLAEKLYNFITMVNVRIVHHEDTQGSRKWRAEWKLQHVQLLEYANRSQGRTT